MYNFTYHPFHGFYQSIHNAVLDNELERLVEDHKLDVDQADQLFGSIDWSRVMRLYIVEYVDMLTDHLANDADRQLPSLRFTDLVSPREYNFTTDKLELSMDKLDWMHLLEHFNRERLQALLTQYFTPCDGFIPFYSNDVDDWVGTDESIDDLLHTVTEEADEVQRGMFFLACFNEGTPWDDFDIIEDCDSLHEKINQFIDEAMSAEGQQLLEQARGEDD